MFIIGKERIIIANVITIHGYDGRRQRYFGRRRVGAGGTIKLNDQIIENREELRRIIEMLNGHIRDEKRERDLNSNRLRANVPVTPLEADLGDDSVVDEQVDRLKGLLGRLQRSYDHQFKAPEDLQNSRIHVIANPEVLEEFKRRIRGQHHSTSSDDSDSSLSDSLTYYKNVAMDQNTNGGLFADVENVNSDVDRYAPANKRNLIVIMRKSRLGSPYKGKIGAESNEIFDGSKISWGQMDASHEKFSPSKAVKHYDLDLPKKVQSRPIIYSDEAPPLKSVIKNIRQEYDERPVSSETWTKPKVKVNMPKWDEEPRSHKSRGRGGRVNARTSIPYIGNHIVYEK